MNSVKRLDAGPFDVGSTALIKQTGLPEAKWMVTSLTRGEGFTWESRIRGINMIAMHKLAPVESGTLSVLRLELFGIAALAIWPLLRFAVRWVLERENTSLKAKCEALAAS